MYKGKVIAVVIPAYNEAEFVGNVIETVPSFVDRIYPVDDCSTDGTWEEIKRTASRLNSRGTDEKPHAKTVADGGQQPVVIPRRHDQNCGVGGAIKTGYRRAVEDGVDVVAVMNGDGQMDPSILHRILDPVVEGRAEYAKGNRLMSSDHWDGMSRFRLFGNSILTLLTRIASGYWRMTDPQNGYTAIATSALEQLDFEALHEEYGFLNSLLIRLNAHEMRIADVEMAAVYGDESSGIRYHRFIPRLSWLLFRNFLWRLRAKYGAGDRLVAVPYLAGLVGSLLFIISLSAPVPPIDQPSMTAGSIGFLLFCLFLFCVGIVLDHRRNRALTLSIRK